MKVAKLDPLPVTRVVFQLRSFKYVPATYGCYVLATFDNDILYIGLSDNLNTRFTQHLANPEKIKPTKDGKAVWYYFMTYNPKNLAQLERTWLHQFINLNGRMPILNKISSPLK